MASEQFKSVVSTTIHVTDALYVRDVPVTGGGGGGGVAALSSQGAGTSLVFNSTGVLKSVSAGTNVTITESTPGVLVIAATAGGGGVAALSSQGAGTSLVYNTTGVLKSVSAGPNVTITESTPGVLVIAATGTALPAVGASGNVLTSDGTNWSSQPLPTSGDEGSTLPAPGSSGNVLTSDGTVWSSQPPVGDALPSAGASGNVLTSDGTDWSSQPLPTSGDEGSTLPAPGSSGNVLTSDGTVWSSQPPTGDALPSAGASGNVLTSDGTNWSSQALPSTGDEGSTLPAPGSSGNVLTSDGTVWSSQPPVGDALPSAGASGNVLTSDGTNWSSQALPSTGDEGSTLPAPGSTGNVLTSDGTVWSSQPLPGGAPVLSYITTGVNALGDTAVGSGTTMVWDAGPFMRNVNNCVVLGGGNTTFTPTREGEYEIHTTLPFVNKDTGGSHIMSSRLMLNGVQLRLATKSLAPNASDVVFIHWIGHLTTSDVITLRGEGDDPTYTFVRGSVVTKALESFFSMKFLGVA